MHVYSMGTKRFYGAGAYDANHGFVVTGGENIHTQGILFFLFLTLHYVLDYLFQVKI